MKTTATTSGRIGEDLAEKLYRKKGYTILARNYLAKGGELDIVAYRLGILVFAEVKTRSSDFFGTPLEAVDEKKMCRIRVAEWEFLHRHYHGGMIPVWSRLLGRSIRRPVFRMRNDIVAVYLNDTRREVTIHKNMFEVPKLR